MHACKEAFLQILVFGGHARMPQYTAILPSIAHTSTCRGTPSQAGTWLKRFGVNKEAFFDPSEQDICSAGGVWGHWYGLVRVYGFTWWNWQGFHGATASNKDQFFSCGAYYCVIHLRL